MRANEENKKNAVEQSEITSGRDTHIGDSSIVNISFSFRTTGVLFFAIMVVIVSYLIVTNSSSTIEGQISELSISLVDIKTGRKISTQGSISIYSDKFQKSFPIYDNLKVSITDMPLHLIGDSVTVALGSSTWKISGLNNRFLLKSNSLDLPVEKISTKLKITGEVLNDLGQSPVEGAEIIADDTIVRTDKTGRFSLFLMDCSEGEVHDLTIEKNGYDSRKISYDCGSKSDLTGVKLSKSKPKRFKLVKILSQNFDPSTGGTQAFFEKDTFPLAFIDDAYKEGNTEKAMINSDACIYTFVVANISDQNIFIDNIYVKVKEYEEIRKYEVNQPFSFKESQIAYIHLGKTLGAEYPVNFYVIGGQRKDFGKLNIEPGKEETVSVRINAKFPGIYTLDCFTIAKSQTEGARQRVELFTSSSWVFDQE